LFPGGSAALEYPDSPALSGIARLAAESGSAPSRRGSPERPEYFVLPVRSILNRVQPGGRVQFEWSINPYRGCEFGCKYCYARYTHEYMELDGCEFERKIFVKRDAAELLKHELPRKYRGAGQRGEKPEHIAIGTATDPYQPAEREYGVTRSCLKELAAQSGLSVSITTKSNLVVQDIDLLQDISRRSALFVNITITTLRSRLARLLEPRAPRPDLRIAAVARLREAGIAAGVFASPLLPGFTDGDGELEAVAEAAARVGALWFGAGVLFLRPSSAKQFLPFLREKFPRLVGQYEQWFVRNGETPESYRARISQRIAKIRALRGLSSRPWEERERALPCAQLSLALGGPNG
jgi:DNA repair photolyase